MRSRPNSSAKADQCTKEWTVKKQFFSWFLSTQKTGRSAPSAVPTGKSSLRATKEHWAQQMIVRHSSPRSHHISSIGPRDFRSRDFRSWLFYYTNYIRISHLFDLFSKVQLCLLKRFSDIKVLIFKSTLHEVNNYCSHSSNFQECVGRRLLYKVDVVLPPAKTSMSMSCTKLRS